MFKLGQSDIYLLLVHWLYFSISAIMMENVGKGLIFVSVRELVDTLDNSLVLELYGYGSKSLEHKGTFDLELDSSRQQLLEQYGTARVKRNDVYKAYVLVYLDKE